MNWTIYLFHGLLLLDNQIKPGHADAEIAQRIYFKLITLRGFVRE